jgi:2-oxoglutarate ferredoxin oxidoreductase subunit alpha
MILADGMLGQMMEPLNTDYTDKKTQITQIKKPWALTGAKNRAPNIIRSLFLGEGQVEALNKELQEKYKKIEAQEQRFEAMHLDDSSLVLVAYGTMARLCKQIVRDLRAKGEKIGLLRPISLWPFPKSAFAKVFSPLASADVRQNFKRERPKIKPTFLVIEMSYGQMVEDVRLAVNGKCRVEFFGRAGGGIPTEEEILKEIDKIYPKVEKEILK